MRLNADFSERARVTPADELWQGSPESGVDRLMLDRIGDEVARATSIVRYAAGSSFAQHEHAMGEEFLVLEGVFSDASGDYPAGTYVRNPPGTSHAPFSEHGCRILVKLRQFDDADLVQFSIDTLDDTLWDDVDRLPLHAFGSERVQMRRLAPHAVLAIEPADTGTEVLVVDGALQFSGEVFHDETWFRFPPGDSAALTATQPTTVWMKTGHLTEAALARYR